MYLYLFILMSVICFIEAGFIVWLLKSQKKPKPDQTATQLLQHLFSSGAVVVTQVIDPSSMFVHAPRDRS